MIRIRNNNINLLEISEKLKYVKDCKIKEESFYFYMWNGVENGTIFPYASYELEKMTGCMVLSLGKDLKSTVLSLIFVWIDSKYPKLYKEYLKFASETAKRMGADEIQINTSRNPKVIERKLGKYGFKAKYVIFAKDVN